MMKKYIVSYGNNYGYYNSNKQINILDDTRKEVLYECYLNPKNRKCDFYKYNSNNPNNNKYDKNNENFKIEDCYSIKEPELKDDELFKIEKESFLSLHSKHLILNKENQLISTMERKTRLFSHSNYNLTMINGQQYFIIPPKSKVNFGGFEIYDGDKLIGNFHFNSAWVGVDYELFLNEQYDEPFFLLVSIIANNFFSSITPSRRKMRSFNKNPNFISSGSNGMNWGGSLNTCDSGGFNSFGCDSGGGGFGCDSGGGGFGCDSGGGGFGGCDSGSSF
ncbi:hypothetical protein ACTFIT_002434 [Dictyostelium discoideum]